MAEQIIEAKVGQRATFVVQILFKQNATWQGSITWSEKKKVQHFRSTLEMIKLMDDAIEYSRTGRTKLQRLGIDKKPQWCCGFFYYTREERTMPMTTKEYKPHDASVLKVCLDDFGQNDFSGRIISRYMPQPLAFVGVAAMLTQMEAIMDHLGYPQKYRQIRSFNQPTTTKGAPRQTSELMAYMEPQEFDAQIGRQATFVVRVEFRQNATWQGSLAWKEHGQTLSFDSTLEMVKLMDGAVEKLALQPRTEKHW